MFCLQKYKGKSTRHTCPICGIMQSFTLYVDNNNGSALNPKVGKCNRESKCGYHYPPKQYFSDYPLLSNLPTLSTSIGSCLNPSNFKSQIFQTIPFSYLEQSQSQNSNFITFLKKYFPENDIKTICNKYLIGATKNKEVIFWQIDVNYKIRTGKIMQYNPETGKRIKHQNGAINWVHNKLKQSKQLPDHFNLEQCFFGEHLLKIFPTATVAIVESEKSAIIASIIIPDLIWLATGGIQGLTIEKCQVLKNRNIILFPDLGASEKWCEKAPVIENQFSCSIKVSTLLENIATPRAKSNGLDIADYISTDKVIYR